MSISEVFMGRDAIPHQDRVRRRTWIRALRISAAGVPPFSGTAKGVTTWTGLYRELLKPFGESALKGRLQGIMGVVNDGNDPRELVRRVSALDLEWTFPKDTTLVDRLKSGRPDPEVPHGQSIQYMEIPIDLVEAGEQLCPGSSYWESAFIWTLSQPVLPRLEEIRVAISYLKARLNLCSPTMDEYSAHLDPKEYGALSRLSQSDMRRRYTASLEPLAKAASADSLSLLAALVAESFVVDQHELLKLHKEYFSLGVEILLAHRLMTDVSKEFREWGSDRILATGWRQPAAYHVSSMSAPLIPKAQWEEITGETNLVSLY